MKMEIKVKILMIRQIWEVKGKLKVEKYKFWYRKNLI
jgi:hypothetical protein